MNCELENLRKEIDKTDEKITELLIERLEISAKVAEVKLRCGAEIYAPEREQQLLSRIGELSGPEHAERIRAVYEAILAQSRDYQRQRMKNIVLIGMPGSGKSSVGRALADKLGREFADTDLAVEELTERSIPELFEEKGEAFFREIEHTVLETASARRGIVIATGGGIVLREDNRELLKKNAVVIWLRRSLDELPTDGRPLSRKSEMRRLFDERAPLYELCADLMFDNDGGDPTETAEKLMGVIRV